MSSVRLQSPCVVCGHQFLIQDIKTMTELDSNHHDNIDTNAIKINCGTNNDSKSNVGSNTYSPGPPKLELEELWTVFCDHLQVDRKYFSDIFNFYSSIAEQLPFCQDCFNKFVLQLFHLHQENLAIRRKITRLTTNITAEIVNSISGIRQCNQNRNQNINASKSPTNIISSCEHDNDHSNNINYQVIVNEKINQRIGSLRQNIAQHYKPQVVLTKEPELMPQEIIKIETSDLDKENCRFPINCESFSPSMRIKVEEQDYEPQVVFTKEPEVTPQEMVKIEINDLNTKNCHLTINGESFLSPMQIKVQEQEDTILTIYEPAEVAKKPKQNMQKKKKKRKYEISNTQNEGGGGKVECPSCKKVFPIQRYLAYHLSRVKKCQDNVGLPHIRWTKKEDDGQGQQIYLYDNQWPVLLVGKDGETNSEEVRWYDPGVCFRCLTCGRERTKAHWMNTHIEHYHSAPVSHLCGECGKSFLLRSSLQQHQKTHRPNNPYQCKLCERKFKIKKNVISHLRGLHNIPIKASYSRQVVDDELSLYVRHQAQEESDSRQLELDSYSHSPYDNDNDNGHGNGRIESTSSVENSILGGFDPEMEMSNVSEPMSHIKIKSIHGDVKDPLMFY